MNYFNELPAELRERIFELNEIPASITIQRIWRGRQTCEQQAWDFMISMYTFEPGEANTIDPMDPDVARKLEYCANHTGGMIAQKNGVPDDNDYNIWFWFVRAVHKGLWENEFVDGPGSHIYARTEKALSKLARRILTEDDVRYLEIM